MSPARFEADRWRRIEEIFQATLDLPADQREALLRESCGDDQQLRDEVESLLARASPESPLIEGIIEDATADLCEEDSPEQGVATLHKRNARSKL